MTAAGEMDRVPVAKSRDARGSSESGAGRVDVRGLAASMAVDEMGPVTIIVGGWWGLASPDDVDTVMYRIPEECVCTGDSGIPAAPTRGCG